MSKHVVPISELISNLPLFSELDPRAIERLAAGSTVLAAPKGTVVMRRGDPSIGFQIVLSGHVKLCLQAIRGDERVIALLGRGESFGESSMFLEQACGFTAESLIDSKVIQVSKQTVLAEIDRDPRFAHRMIASLSRRLIHFISGVEAYTLRSGPQRVANYLLEQLNEQSYTHESAITFPAQKGIIASHLNLTQEHFSRILHGLAAAGLIEVQGRLVRILDARALRSSVS